MQAEVYAQTPDTHKGARYIYTHQREMCIREERVRERVKLGRRELGRELGLSSDR